MNITKTWDKQTKVELAPVYGRGDNEENKTFWKYTPSGECQLHFSGPSFDADNNAFKVGDYYYIDMVTDAEGGWRVSQLIYRDKESGDVELSTRGGSHTAGPGEIGFRYGKLGMGIDNPPAFQAYSPESNWKIEFHWAEASDD
jgi:hypothetical protein